MNQYQLVGWQIVIKNKSEFTTLPYIPNRPKQEHGNVITTLRSPDQPFTPADGVLLDRSGYVGISTADCLPLILLTLDQALALHVSRKTLILGLLDKVPDVLPLAEVEAVFIGPHICADHFVFEYAGPSIIEFQQRFPDAVTKKADGLHLSLQIPVMAYLKQWGIDNEKITIDDRCTFIDDYLPSYRRTFLTGQPDNPENRFITAVRAK